MPDKESLAQKLKNRFGLKQNIGAGMIVLFFLLLFRFFVSTFSGLTIFPDGVEGALRQLFFFVSADFVETPGMGLLLLIPTLYIAGFIARTRVALLVIKKVAGYIPIFGDLAIMSIDMMENITNLVLIEAEFGGVVHKCWLREVRRERNLDTGETWLGIYVILLTMPNPSSGFVFRLKDPSQVVHKLDNPSRDAIQHLMTASSHNPEWLYRNFDPEDYLGGGNPLPKRLQEKAKELS